MTPFRLSSRARRLVPLAAVTAACAILGHSGTAEACGGLFCSAANPVSQTAERIIFATNDDGTITCIVEIQYEGPSESFSWVLPVPGEPQVDVSSTAALDRLQQASNPTYQLQTNFADCGSSRGDSNFLGAPTADEGGSGGGGNGVTVVASGTTGPYDWEVINVDPTLPDPADVAVDWLELNGYDLPPNGREVLRPYLADGLNLIGFKLTKSADAGSIRPVILRYASSIPFIPIRPTAVAATEDMGILVWVLGDSRAVPVNYRTLELNESLIDWFNPNPTYNEVVIAAANEAGGQGFVTEQSGAAFAFADTIWQSWEREQLTYLDPNLPVPNLLLQATQTFGFLDGFPEVIRETVPLRTGWTAEDFIACVECYYREVSIDPYGNVPPLAGSDPSLETVPVTFLAELQRQVITPMEETRRVFEEHAYVTRMYTTLSADEMTVDPKFDFNPELEDVSNVHVATQTLSCMTDSSGNSSWQIELPNGVMVTGEGTEWPVSVGEDDLPANLRVLQHSTSGDGEVITDNTEVIRSHFANDSSGCGCRTAGTGASSRGWLLLAGAAFAGFGLRRRRLAK